MPIKNLTLGACLLFTGTALAQNHHNTHKTHGETHVVKRGETIAQIAKWTGVSKQKIVAANNLNGKKVKPGFVLTIPYPPHQEARHFDLSLGGWAPYTVRKNDSDWKIANMFHMAPRQVRTMNPWIAWDHPHAGTKIRNPMKNAFLYQLAKIPVIRSRYALTTHDDTVVRSAPGSSAPRLAKVTSRRHVAVLDRDDHWYKVRFEYGTVGWVRGDLLVAEEPKIVAVRHEPHHYAREREVVAYHAPKHYHPEVHRAGRASREGYTANLPSAGGDMMTFAESYKGTPYSYGSSSRHATDCSGYTLQVLRHEGVNMPRTAAQQSHKGEHVGKDEMKAGDLVFFHTVRGSRISHVGIYMGDGKFIHASSGGGKVQVNSLNEGYYKRRFATARRVAKVKHEAPVMAKAEKHDEKTTEPTEEVKPTSQGTDKIDN